MSTPLCSTCNVEMEIGFVPEATAGGYFVTVWHPGEASHQKAGFLERLASPGGVRYAHQEARAVDAWRCPGCGRLDLYATRPPGQMP